MAAMLYAACSRPCWWLRCKHAWRFMNLHDWDNLRRALRELHRALVERASRDHVWKQQRLAQPDPGELLQMLTKDPEFDWLRGLSELMVEIDVARDNEDTRDRFAPSVRTAVERFISPPAEGTAGDEFAQRYWPYVQQDPQVAMAHGALKQAITKWPRTA
jgi:hypothetical protein